MIAHFATIDHIILFFFLGMIGSWLGSDLEIPESIAKFLSIFLLVALGVKGGHEVAAADDMAALTKTFLLGVSSCLLIPSLIFFGLRHSLGRANASALAAAYGSVSAVTLITAQTFLENDHIAYSGFMVAVMALMEIPAIVLAVAFYRWSDNDKGEKGQLGKLFATKSVVLLVGGFIIGLVMSDRSWTSVAPVMKDGFKGALAFFLIDLGIAAQRQISDAWKWKWSALFVGAAVPLAAGTLTLLAARALGLPTGDQVLISVLAGSASYIAAPAAIRHSIPSASPSLYVALPLSLTFPMNILIGIPYYIGLSHWLG